MSSPTPPLSAVAPALPPLPDQGAAKLPLWIKIVLCLDMLFCIVQAANAGLVLAGVGYPDSSGQELWQRYFEGVTSTALAVLAALCNLFLLQRKPAARWLLPLAVLALLSSLVAAIWRMGYEAFNPERLDCPVEVHIVGALFGLAVRGGYNLLWLITAWQARRFIRAAN